jgi:hypothetical protein
VRLRNGHIKQARPVISLIPLILEKAEQERDFFVVWGRLAAIKIPQQ